MISKLYRPALIILLLTTSEAYGQNYSFKVKYGLIHAGTAEMVHRVEKGILTSTFNIESSPWLSNLWTLSDSIWSTYNIDLSRLQDHRKAIHEGSYHRSYHTKFTDSNTVIVNQKLRSINKRGFRDIPSLLFDLTRVDFSSGDTLHYQLWDGQGAEKISLLVEKTPKPSFFRPFAEPGWKLTPLNSTRKSRENQVQLALLLSESFPHIPLKIQINTKYGNVTMRLENP